MCSVGHQITRSQLVRLDFEPIRTAATGRSVSFWIQFFRMADKEIRICQESGDAMPFVPSECFQQMYETAVQKHSGLSWFRVREVARIFKFREF